MKRRQQQGQELVELAVTLPFFVLLLLIVGQVAAAVSAQQILSNAVREGARLAVVPGESGHVVDVQQRVVGYAASNGIALPATAVTVVQNKLVSPSGGGCSGASPCLTASRVSVSYPYPVALLLGSHLQLGAAVEMRNFY